MAALCLTVLALMTCLPNLMRITVADKRLYAETLACAWVYKCLSSEKLLGSVCGNHSGRNLQADWRATRDWRAKGCQNKEDDFLNFSIILHKDKVCVYIQIYSREMSLKF